MVADVSFEMEDGGVEAMMLGGVKEGVEEEEEDGEVEYMPPTAYSASHTIKKPPRS